MGSGTEYKKSTAPYGTWQSEITKEALFSGSWSMGSPRICRRTGRSFFAESRSDGNVHLMEFKDNGECNDVLPPVYSARSRVYEYGGGAYAILPKASTRLIFSDFKDYSVNVLDVDSGDVKALLASDTLRYGDFDAHPDQPWVLAVEEDHTIDIPEKVKNYVVAINTDTGDVRRLVSGSDFYMFPSFSHDGKTVCWVEWNFPDMPWSGVKLFWADWKDDALDNVRLVAGDNRMSVTEPRWGVDGYLCFCQERSDYRQMFRVHPERGEDIEHIKFDGFAEVEIGRASMGLGSHSYVVLSDKLLVASYTNNGASGVAVLNLETKEVLDLPSLVEVTLDGLERLSDTSFLVISSDLRNPQALYRIDIVGVALKPTVLRVSTDQNISQDLFSLSHHIQVPSKRKPDRTIHGFFSPPHNPKFTPPAGENPPLIVVPHGGPTSHTAPGLKLEYQYWTSRGYAIFAINYSGSSGHGKAYRDSLNGNWGVLDVDDVAECVRFLADTGLVNGAKVGIRGGSAGGYSVLQALCNYPEIFAGGVCLYGISEVKLLLDSTHKMESQYVDMLMFTTGMDGEDKEKVMRERSPVYHAGNVTAPLLILHGEDDKVVPISQAYTMYDDIRRRGGDVELVKFPGEGHGFRNGNNQLKALEEEERWWQKTLVNR